MPRWLRRLFCRHSWRPAVWSGSVHDVAIEDCRKCGTSR